MKDLLIVYGRNHYPEDIESTVPKITGGRVAARSASAGQTEQLLPSSNATHQLTIVQNGATAAISESHGLNVTDLVPVSPGSIPPRRAVRSGGRPVLSSIAGSSSPDWTPDLLLTILVMAAAVSLEPFRIAMTVLMLNRPRPMLQLLAFLGGGYAMGMTVGLIVLFVLRRRLLGSTYFTLPRVQIMLGLLALLVAAALAIRVVLGRPGGRPEISARTRTLQRLLTGRSLWIAAAAGLGIALPSVDYLAALAVILASGAAATTQVAAVLLFNVVAFALVEIPLVAYLLAPQATRASMAALHDWIRSRRRMEVAALLTGVGCVLLIAGAAGH